MGAFSAEIAIILFGYLLGNVVVETSFLFLTGMTAIAMALFLIEGIRLQRKCKPTNYANNV